MPSRPRPSSPDAVPVAGGTDVMVEINFDHRRPPALLDLTRVPELREWAPDGGPDPSRRRRHLHAASSTSWATGCPGWRWRPAPSARRRSATAAPSAATWAPPRRPATATRPLLAADAEVEVASVRGTRLIPVAEFYTGVKRNALAAGRADRGRAGRAGERAAAVLQDRHPQRDGDRRRRVRARAAPRPPARSAPASARRRPPRAAPPRPPAFLAGELEAAGLWESRGELPEGLAVEFGQPRPRRRRPRSTTCAAAPRTACTPSR